MIFKRLSLLAFAIVTVQAVNWPELRSKYGETKENSFYAIPRTEAEAIEQGWTQSPEAKLENNQRKLKAYSFESNPSISALYDLKGSIAAYEISIPSKTNSSNIDGVNYETLGWTQTKRWGQDSYTSTAYFVPQEIIQNGGRDFNKQTGTGLWLNVGNGLIQMANLEKDVSKQTPMFIKQKCYDRMGQHYFYQTEYQPFFLLYDPEGELQGFGVRVFGRRSEDTLKKNVREWWENIAPRATPAFNSDFPKWITDYMEKYGSSSHHVYFKNEPWNHKCR